MKYLICVILVTMSGCLCTGCRVAWTDNGFFMGLMTDFKAKDSTLYCDPNELRIGVGEVDSETDDIDLKLTHPSGAGIGLVRSPRRMAMTSWP